MANRRMLSRTISTSLKLSRVPDFSALLYTWLIPHCDDGGNMEGDTMAIKATVMPARDVSLEQIQIALDELEKETLVSFYLTKNGDEDEEKFIHIVKWEKYQTLRNDRIDRRFPDFIKQISKDGKPTGNHVATTGNRNVTERNVTERNVTKHYPSPNGDDKYTKYFLEFWKEYPRKVGKGAAGKSWNKIKGISKDIIIKAVKAQRNQEQWQKDNGQYIPHPSTWLNQRRWEDEIIKVQKEVSFK